MSGPSKIKLMLPVNAIISVHQLAIKSLVTFIIIKYYYYYYYYY